MENMDVFTILAIGQFSFSVPEKKGVIQDFPGKIEESIPAIDASIAIPMEKRICREGGLDLTFKHLDDFSLERIIANNHWLANLKSAVDYITKAGQKGESTQNIYHRLTAWENLPLSFDPPDLASFAK